MSSIHSYQGLTCDSLYVIYLPDVACWTEPGMGYSALTRIEESNNLLFVTTSGIRRWLVATPRAFSTFQYAPQQSVTVTVLDEDADSYVEPEG